MKNIDFERSPIIAAVRDGDLLQRALQSPCEIIFLLSSSIITLDRVIELVHERGKLLFVHMDFAEGFGKDAAGVEMLARMGADGIISTRASIVKLANQKGLSSVQRFFVVDSQSIDTAVDSVKNSMPDMIEIMPGTIFKAIKRLKGRIDIPFIAGGLIDEKQDVISALSAGARAVSTSSPELWSL